MVGDVDAGFVGERPVLFYGKIDAWFWSQNVFESGTVDREVGILWLGFCVGGLRSSPYLFFLRYMLQTKSVVMYIDTLTHHVLTLQLEGSAILVLHLPIAKSRNVRST